MQSLVVGKLLFSLFIYTPGPNAPESTFTHECKVYENSVHVKRTYNTHVVESDQPSEMNPGWESMVYKASLGRMLESLDTDMEMTSDYSAYLNGKKVLLMDSKIGDVGHYNLSDTTDELIEIISEKCD